jgi:histidine triad (HIT) family protein
LTPKYESDNIFAKILRGDAPCVKVYEDDVSLAFMDVMPRIEGHTLVIPKASARTLFDLDPDDLALLMPAVQKVGRAVMVGMKAEGLLLQQFNAPRRSSRTRTGSSRRWLTARQSPAAGRRPNPRT